MSSQKIKISGIAVREGISRNDIKYTAEELNKFAPTLINRPILKDHNASTDNTIGKITHVESIDNGVAVKYKGWIKEDGSGIVEKIKDGRIEEVSIGSMVGQLIREKKGDSFVIAKDMVALELSTVPVPGVVGTSLNADEKFTDEKIKEWIKNYDKSQSSSKDENERRLNMESEKVKTVEVKPEVDVKEFHDKIATLEKEKAELKEARRQDAITRYTEKAKAKKLPVKNCEKFTIETIIVMAEMVDDAEEPKPEVEPKPEKAEEEPKEEAKEEPEKEVAEPKSEETDDSEETSAEEDLSKYKVESSSLGGYAFFEFY